MNIISNIQQPILRKKMQGHFQNLNSLLNFQYYNSLTSLYSSLVSCNNENTKINLFIIDAEDIHLLEVLNSIKNKSIENAQFLSISISLNNSKIIDLLQHGFNGCIDYTFNEIELYAVILSLTKNQIYLSDENKNLLIQDLIFKERSTKNHSFNILQKTFETLNDLTVKETEVFELLLKGYTYKQIGQILGISFFIINQRAKSIYKKCQVNSRNQLSYKFQNTLNQTRK